MFGVVARLRAVGAHVVGAQSVHRDQQDVGLAPARPVRQGIVIAHPVANRMCRDRAAGWSNREDPQGVADELGLLVRGE